MNKFLLNQCYAELSSEGFNLILLKPRSKRPARDGWPNMSVDAAVSARLKGYNIGVKVDKGHCIVDWDPRNARGADPRLTFAPLPDWSVFPQVLTPGGGIHYYMRVERGERIAGRPGLDIKAVGSQVLAPYCEHPNGGLYEWDLSTPPLSSCPLIPQWLLPNETVVSSDHARTHISVERMALALLGVDAALFRRHDEWFRMMCACHEACGDAPGGMEAFILWSISDPKYAGDEGLIAKRWKSLKRSGAGPGASVAGLGTLNHLLLSVGAEGVSSAVAMEFQELAASSDSGRGVTLESVVGDRKRKLEDLRKTDPVAWLNETGHAIVHNGGRAYAAFRQYGEWCFSVRGDFLVICQSIYGLKNVSMKVGDEEKSVPAGRYWFDHCKKKAVLYGIGYEPRRDGSVVLATSDGKLNTWCGYGVEPSKLGSWEIMRELVFKGACKSNLALYEYLTRWMASVVQNPGVPSGIAVVMQGPKGTGKTTITSQFMKLFGRHAMAVTSKEQLLGRFNAHLEGKSLIVASEAFWAGSKAGEGTLKALITDTHTTYERKGMTPYSGANCVNMMITSNEDWVVPASLDERRFFVLEFAPEAALENRSWWKALIAQMDGGGLGRMLRDLMDMDLSGFDIRDVPNTEGLREQQLLSMDLVEQWLYEIADAGEWEVMGLINQRREGVAVDADAGTPVYLKEDVRQLFKDRFDRKNTVSDVWLSRRMSKYGIKPIRIRNASESFGDKPTQIWAYMLPAIWKLRKMFKMD